MTESCRSATLYCDAFMDFNLYKILPTVKTQRSEQDKEREENLREFT